MKTKGYLHFRPDVVPGISHQVSGSKVTAAAAAGDDMTPRENASHFAICYDNTIIVHCTAAVLSRGAFTVSGS